MNTHGCPGCGNPLPPSAFYCVTCGRFAPALEPRLISSLAQHNDHATSDTLIAEKPEDRTVVLQLPHVYPVKDGLSKADKRLGNAVTVNTMRQTSPNARNGLALQKRSNCIKPAVNSGLYATGRKATWHKVVPQSSNRAPISVPPRPAPSRPVMRETGLRHLNKSAVSIVVALVALIGLIFGSIFGVVMTRGNEPTSSAHGTLSLQVTPAVAAVGATLTLRGAHFSPGVRVGLTRDNAIPLQDTGGARLIEADEHGSFSDTVVVTEDWGNGTHTLSAEDAITHKIASFPIMVTGKGLSLRPPHLQLTPGQMDMGPGDEITHSFETLTLKNAGGGQISWQGTTTQSWLQLTPKSGSFVRGQDAQVTVAVDRSNLNVGAYSAQILITSSAGNSTVAVQMSVTPLHIGNNAVLQVSPAALAFTAADGASSPPAQTVTVSNPGKRALNWRASTDADWLKVSPQADTLNASASESMAVRIDASRLLPGTYSGKITLSVPSSANVLGSPQSVYVSITITPQCSLQLSPSLLTFTGSYLGAAPSAKTINVTSSTECHRQIGWSATSNARWLTINMKDGRTPASPAVNINTRDLLPGTYNSSILFTWDSGTYTLPVTLTLSQLATPVPQIKPALLTFNATIGQGNPGPQTVLLTNAGGAAFKWRASATTALGGNWLTITPGSGILTAGSSVALTARASLLNGLPAGTYGATITISGVDSAGHTIAGSPLMIPVSFVVKDPCVLTTSPNAINLSGVANQSNPATQSIMLTASASCTNKLTWVITGSTQTGAQWLPQALASGTITPGGSVTSSITASLVGLAAGTYNGTATISATDSVTKQSIGRAQIVPVTLTVQPACTLERAPGALPQFVTQQGSSPAAQSFTIGVDGACAGSVTITAQASTTSGGNWLSISPGSATIQPGGKATFTIMVAADSLTSGAYTGIITLSATTNGSPIAASQQSVGVNLNVMPPPSLAASPGSASMSATTGKASQVITISNAGDGSLNWTATLDASAPSFISLSAGAGNNLGAGTSTAITITADATGVQPGTYTTSVIITATNSATGRAVNSSPITIPITVTVIAP